MPIVMTDTSGKSRVVAPIRSKEMKVNPQNNISSSGSLKPLLSAEEEINLAIVIQAGLKAKEKPRVKGNKKLITDGQIAENHFVESNLRLAHYVARQYINRGIEYDDLVQEATLGLIHAISKFDPNRGYRFSTYAMPWIKQYITRSIGNHGRSVRLPLYQVEAINKLRSIHNQLIASNNIEPTIAELALATGMNEEKIRELKEISQSSFSIDAPISEDGTGVFGDLLPATDKMQPESAFFTALSNDRVNNMLDSLREKEALVLKLRFGFEGSESLSLDQIGKQLNLTRERVRQIENEALSKLRHPARTNGLSALLS